MKHGSLFSGLLVSSSCCTLCSMAHSLYWRKRGMQGRQAGMGSWCSPCILMAPKIHSVMAVYSVVDFFPQPFVRVPVIGSTYISTLLCFLCSDCTEEEASAGLDLDIRLTEMSRTLQHPCANLWKHLLCQSSSSWKKKPNGRKGVGCVLMNNKTTFLLFFSFEWSILLLARKVLPNDNGRVVKLWAMFVRHITAALFVFMNVSFRWQ